MKKNILRTFIFLFSFFYSLSSFGQITVTRTDFADIGDMTINAHDSVPSVSPGNSGASQTWNLSGIANHYADTTIFSNPSSTPYAASFPTANLAGFNTRDSAYYYVNASVNSIDALGYVAPNPFNGNALILALSPPQPQITFPSTNATTFSNTATATSGAFYFFVVLDSSINLTADSFRITQTIIRNSVIDGWGTTTTPAGTFNSLRQHVVDSTATEVEAFVRLGIIPIGWQPAFNDNGVSSEYYYLANGQKWAIAQVGTDSAGNVNSAQYLTNVVIGIEEFNFSGNDDVVLYPNPSQGEINISVLNHSAASLEVYNMLGRKTETILLNNISVSHSFEAYAKGLYSFRVLGKNGEPISSGKFIIEK